MINQDKAFYNASGVPGSLVTSYSLVVLINQSLICIYYNDGHG